MEVLNVIPTEKGTNDEESHVYLILKSIIDFMKTKGTHNYYVYILTNKIKTVLYVGVSNNLKERLYFHRNPEANTKSFTAKYKVFYLIYYEHFFDINHAIEREKEIKGWRREKKENLINLFNSKWNFLNNDI